MRYRVDYGETRLEIQSDVNLKAEAGMEVERLSKQLLSVMDADPFFKIAYEPVQWQGHAPEFVQAMLDASQAAGVGPMAAVAGAIAEYVGEFMLGRGASEVVVDNGGDIYLKLSGEKIVGIHAGQSDFSDRLAFRVQPGETPLGVCTSSSSLGHRISLGEADAVTVVAKSTPLADAAATAVANQVRGARGLEAGVAFAKQLDGIDGVVIIHGSRMGVWGRLPEIVGAGYELFR